MTFTLASTPFKTEFAVDMTCKNCVDAVKTALQDMPGIDRYDVELDKKRVTVTGKTPPSQLLAALKGTQRQVIVRGSSAADPNVSTEAAITIFESPINLPPSLADQAPKAGRELPGLNEAEFSQKVFGIARFIQIAPRSILMDMTVRVPPTPPSAYHVYVAKTGNLVDPPRTTGAPFVDLGRVQPDKDGYGDLFKEVDGELWEWIGRACVVEQESDSTAAKSASEKQKNGESADAPKSIFAGVVARSAGAWGNDKTVCACSGRTMWEEGRDMEAKGML